ncbi:hypothetical protein [Methylocapsa sp. S129]|uniref:bestrophin-like domain n=1 Tax=Methylocapsa sp. S129 TaxID=1641869 RepID=UPI00131CAEC4|nr:hypothetical protein [Methylocapsa sp. S129]
MNSLVRSAGIAAVTFACGVVGMLIQLTLPVQYVTDARGTVGAMVGLITLLLALVLGLLIWTAFSVFTTQQAEAQSLGPMILELDLALEKYGPEASGGRALLQAGLASSRKRFYGDQARGPQAFTFEESRANMRGLADYFDGLRPETEGQRQNLATARQLATTVAQTQNLMARQLSNPVPPFLLVVVVCWSGALFLGNGLVSSPNAVTIAAEAAGAIAIASGIFLILELSQPYSGMFRLPSTGVDKLIDLLKS